MGKGDIAIGVRGKKPYENSNLKHLPEIQSSLLLLLLSHFGRVRLCVTPWTPVPGIFQARTLEWVAISFSNAWKWKVKVKSLSPVRPSATPWTAAYQAPPSMGFSKQEYWSGVPLPSPTVITTIIKTVFCFYYLKFLNTNTEGTTRSHDFC